MAADLFLEARVVVYADWFCTMFNVYRTIRVGGSRYSMNTLVLFVPGVQQEARKKLSQVASDKRHAKASKRRKCYRVVPCDKKLVKTTTTSTTKIIYSTKN